MVELEGSQPIINTLPGLASQAMRIPKTELFWHEECKKRV